MEKEIKPIRELVATVYIVKDGKVLLNMNQKLQKFVPIGGHVEESELPSEAAIREAKEESGFDIELINLKSSFPDVNTSSGSSPGRIKLPQIFGIGLDWIKPEHHHINLIYLAKIIGGEQLEKADDGMELRWFTKEEVEDLETFENVKQEAIKSIELLKNLLD